MKLFYTSTSPFVRKVIVLIAETGLEGIETVAASGTMLAPNPEVIARNPLGKIPALMREDGPTLYDSRVICQFLNAQAGASIYPQAPRLWDTLTIEATADGIMDAAILIRYESHIRPEERRFAPWAEAQWAKIERALNALESRWLDHLNGPFDMGHIATVCALDYLDFRYSTRDWRKGRTQLARWLEGISTRPSLQKTQPHP